MKYLIALFVLSGMTASAVEQNTYAKQAAVNGEFQRDVRRRYTATPTPAPRATATPAPTARARAGTPTHTPTL